MNSNICRQKYGLYIHIPFCDGKCPYCDFYSVVGDSRLMDDYTAAVIRAIQLYPKDLIADTLYFGGGTPTLLGAQRLLKIIDAVAGRFTLCDAEITIEANPASVNLDGLKALHAGGVNRISLGVQASSEKELGLLGRRHSADDAKRAASDAFAAGFDNLSADLMLALPEQSVEDTLCSVNFAAALGASHISAYILKVEENTPFARGGISVDDDRAADLYLAVVDQLSALGFSQYEISNFARDGRVSHHNLKYWNCEPYLGIGPSAHSFVDGRRFFLPRDIHSFVVAPNPLLLTVDDGSGGEFEEYVMMRLRLADGLDTKLCEERYGISPEILIEKAQPFERAGLAILANGVIKLTTEGFLVSNGIIGRLLD